MGDLTNAFKEVATIGIPFSGGKSFEMDNALFGKPAGLSISAAPVVENSAKPIIP